MSLFNLVSRMKRKSVTLPFNALFYTTIVIKVSLTKIIVLHNYGQIAISINLCACFIYTCRHVERTIRLHV